MAAVIVTSEEALEIVKSARLSPEDVLEITKLKGQPLLTADTLVQIARELKGGYLASGLKSDSRRNFRNDTVQLTRRDIDVTADALKSNAFFVPTYVYNKAWALVEKERVADQERIADQSESTPE
jgi:hypothetical protein